MLSVQIEKVLESFSVADEWHLLQLFDQLLHFKLKHVFKVELDFLGGILRWIHRQRYTVTNEIEGRVRLFQELDEVGDFLKVLRDDPFELLDRLNFYRVNDLVQRALILQSLHVLCQNLTILNADLVMQILGL